MPADTPYLPIAKGHSLLSYTLEEEEEFYKLRPANKTDHLPTMATMSNLHEVQTVHNVVQDPQMVLLSKQGAHGVSVRCEKVCMLSSQRGQGGTFKNHMHFITNSTTVASQTNPVSPVHMASASQPASSNWQAMTAQPKLQKSLHATPRNRELTTPPKRAIRLKPLLVYA